MSVSYDDGIGICEGCQENYNTEHTGGHYKEKCLCDGCIDYFCDEENDDELFTVKEIQENKDYEDNKMLELIIKNNNMITELFKKRSK